MSFGGLKRSAPGIQVLIPRGRVYTCGTTRLRSNRESDQSAALWECNPEPMARGQSPTAETGD